jgi:predicted dithiol-disulfide oxidoreductase (DUF899 family)
MSELKYPNESPDYRKARDELLEEETALVEKVKAVAEMRRHCYFTTSCMAPVGTNRVCRVRH